jgi:hypothetical protein
VQQQLEYRLDLRGKAGKVDRVRILSRQGRGKFRPMNGDWTKEDALQFRQFAKAAFAVAKGIAPRLDVDQTLRDVNAPPRKGRAAGKPRGLKTQPPSEGLSSETSPRRRRRRRRNRRR